MWSVDSIASLNREPSQRGQTMQRFDNSRINFLKMAPTTGLEPAKGIGLAGRLNGRKPQCSRLFEYFACQSSQTPRNDERF
jgi:hypothetical protein